MRKRTNRMDCRWRIICLIELHRMRHFKKNGRRDREQEAREARQWMDAGIESWTNAIR